MADIIVGCPVAHRDWILPYWFEAVEVACDTAGLKPTYAFVLDERDPCVEIIANHTDDAVLTHLPAHLGADTRRWNTSRYTYMANARNQLLGLVRRETPDRFLSLDSDILVHPELLTHLVADLGEFDAVGGRCYMTETGVKFPSWARISRSGSLQRYDAAGRFAVGVIMAIKLMSPAAYHVDYQVDGQGEDVGWSKACRAKGLRLGWNGAVISKHCLNERMLYREDPRVGW